MKEREREKKRKKEEKRKRINSSQESRSKNFQVESHWRDVSPRRERSSTTEAGWWRMS